jgi:hypothetical protein
VQALYIGANIRNCTSLCPGFIIGEEKANIKDADDTISKEGLANLQRQLQMLHHSFVEARYKDAYERCAPVEDRYVKPSAIQELVVCWKVLHRWKTLERTLRRPQN